MSVTQQPISTFTVTVSGRTLTPVGTVAINDLRPRTPTGPLTFAGVVNGAQFDVYALAVANNQYSLLALPGGTSVAGRTDVLALGSVIDYVSTGAIQWIPLSGSSLDTYIKLLADGVHVLPFGNLGYAGMVLQTVDGISNNYLLLLNGTDPGLGAYWQVASVGKAVFLGGAHIALSTNGQIQLLAGQDVNLTSSTGKVVLTGNGDPTFSEHSHILSWVGGITLQADGGSFLAAPSLHEVRVIGDYLTLSAHLVSSGTAPTGAATANLGTGATCSVVGTDTGGYFSLLTGSAGVIGGNVQLAAIQFAKSYAAAPKKVTITPANAAAINLARNQDCYVDRSHVNAGNFGIYAGSVALAINTTYEYWYDVVG